MGRECGGGSVGEGEVWLVVCGHAVPVEETQLYIIIIRCVLL